jgi:3,4-dihydroxy-2-butanone 4-phosphate synthase
VISEDQGIYSLLSTEKEVCSKELDNLVALAGLRPVSVLSTVLDPKDGSMAGITILQQMALEHNIPIISIADLIRLVYLKVKPL